MLYSSVDDYLLREVVAAFEARTGTRVRIVGDTEATKTTGLVERLLAEKAAPRADVWWSSEPFGTIRLAREGVLEPGGAPAPEIEGGWPAALEADAWTGFATRARAIVYNPARIPEARVPRSIAAMAAPEFKGRIGMARPQFGTTRGHMGYLLHACGEEAYRALLRSLKAGEVRIYDGNATVVRAVSLGEIDIGLTDTDDVWSAHRNEWPVELVFEEAGSGGCPPAAMLIPNTVALVKGGPNPEKGRELIRFLLSEESERLILASDSHNAPVRPGLTEGYEEFAAPRTEMTAFEAIAGSIPRALAIWDEEMGG